MHKFKTKQEVREYIWEAIKPYSRFPPPYGRIPNFSDAEVACNRLRELKEYLNAKYVFCAPDSPLRRARELAVKDGKVLLVVKPKIKGFLIIEAERFKKSKNFKGTLRDVYRYGKSISPSEINRKVESVDIFIQGCVAIDKFGNRIGKGKGFGDREYELLSKLGKIKDTLYVVICHELQVFEDLSYLARKHDVKADAILTPNRVLFCKR